MSANTRTPLYGEQLFLLLPVILSTLTAMLWILALGKNLYEIIPKKYIN